MRASGAISASRSARKRSTRAASGTIPNGLSTSAALRLGLRVGLELADVRPHLRSVDGVELRIGFARLPRLAELHQRLAEIIEAVLRALATWVAAVVGEQGLRRAPRIALIEKGAADEIVGVADPTMLRIGGGKGFQRTDRLIILSRLPQAESFGVRVLAWIRRRRVRAGDVGAAFRWHLNLGRFLRR